MFNFIMYHVMYHDQLTKTVNNGQKAKKKNWFCSEYHARVRARTDNVFESELKWVI